MWKLIIWWVGIALESAILVRSFWNRTISHYPVFIAYISCVLGSELSRFFIYRSKWTIYRDWWWGTEFLCVLIGYWLIMSILEKALAPYEGPKHMARNVGLVTFSLVVVFTLGQWLTEPNISSLVTSLEVERNLRSAEVVLLGMILLVIFHYGISISDNLRGIIVGYGLYIAVDVAIYATRSFLGQSFQGVFSLIRSLSYLVALVVWVIAMWSYVPVPVAEQTPRLEADYQSLASATREKLGAMRSYLGRSSRR